MKPFRYDRAQTVGGALQSFSTIPDAAFLAGGTSQLDLMKEDVLHPPALIDIKRVPLAAITATKDGGLRLGANATNTTVAYHAEVQRRYIGLAEAILSGASPQIRNMASTGGNLLQRTRCPYYRDTATPCNKREPGTGCAALEGINRVHAVFGASEQCVATHPSDMCVALAALGAVVQVQKPGGGTRSIPFAEFHRLPGDHPEKDTVLEPGELITSVDLPAFTGRSHYLKVRERASYAFALVSVAVAMEMDGDKMKGTRIVLGSVAHKPWIVDAGKLNGQKPDEALFRTVAEEAFKNAKPLAHNGYKIPLGKNVLLRALMETAGLMPLQGAAGTAFAASAGGVAGDDGEKG